MKLIWIVLFVQLSAIAYSQNRDSLVVQTKVSSDSTTFVAILNIENATKDGIYLNGYVVNIDYEQAKKLHGKTIKVSGKVTVIKGLKTWPKEYDPQGQEIIRQGRETDTKYIESPKIVIVENME